VLLSQQGTVSDADLATWMQPLLFMAADAAAAAAAAAAGAGKGIIALSTPAAVALNGSAEAAAAAGGGGVLGLAAGADDLALADSAMTTLAAAVVAGGPEVRVSSSSSSTCTDPNTYASIWLESVQMPFGRNRPLLGMQEHHAIVCVFASCTKLDNSNSRISTSEPSATNSHNPYAHRHSVPCRIAFNVLCCACPCASPATCFRLPLAVFTCSPPWTA
jgi:hypothetical protein